MSRNESDRHLHWDACYNARDLGGYATADGGYTRWGAFVRADNLSRLTPAGQSALIAYGVRTVIDLRRAGELTIDLNPFASRSQICAVQHIFNLPLGLRADREGILAVQAAGEGDGCVAAGAVPRGTRSLLAWHRRRHDRDCGGT